MTTNPAALAYRSAQVHSATPAERVVLLYEGAIRFARQHLAALEAGERETAHNHSLRAQAIVAELRGSLNLDADDSLPKNLESLYGFVTDKLVEGNVKRLPRSTEEAIGVLEGLLPAWRQVAAKAVAR